MADPIPFSYPIRPNAPIGKVNPYPGSGGYFGGGAGGAWGFYDNQPLFPKPNIAAPANSNVSQASPSQVRLAAALAGIDS